MLPHRYICYHTYSVLKLYVLTQHYLQDVMGFFPLHLWEMGKIYAADTTRNSVTAGRLPWFRYLKSWAPSSQQPFAFRQSRAGFRLSDELMDSLQIAKFSSAVGVSGAYANKKAETDSWLRKKIAFNSCFNRSLLSTEPVEVLVTEQALDLSSPKFHRTAEESPFTAALWNICALEHVVQRKIFWEPCFAVDVFGTSPPFFLKIPKNDSQGMKISEQ